MRARWSAWRALALLAPLALAASGCGAPRAEPIRVFAAASLTEAFTKLAQAFEAAEPDVRIALHFAGTPALVLQLREGAPADVFAAADQANMQKVVAAGLTVAPPREFARNHLVIAVAAGNQKGIRRLADLARAELKVALCAPDVPAGAYARQALAKAGVVVRSVSDEPNVTAVVTKVRLGELDAGIVYATDVRGGVAAVPIPEAHDVTASYPLVVLGGGRSRAGGERFASFVASPAGRAILAEHGFLLP